MILLYLPYLLPLLAVIVLYLLLRKRKDRKNMRARKREAEEGRMEPPSLHPVIDPGICLGCHSCVNACPENVVLGVIKGRAELISPTHCIGHGACREACPEGAISLVFGTEKRGIDIPFVKETFESNVPGIFLAGEIGGMGLIRNAVNQGRQAMESAGKHVGRKVGIQGVRDVIIVGAGPAGLAASLSAIEQELDYITLEQETMGGTVAHYPRGKVVMTQPAVLPLVGKTTFTETTKEQLLSFWQEIVRLHNVKVSYSERVESIKSRNGLFYVTTQKSTYASHAVLLTIGRRGTPRKLGVAGEELEKVVYRLVDPEQYRDKRVIVVGGGDSALEAAASIAEISTASVILSYRGDNLARARQKNRDRVEAAEKGGRLRVALGSSIVSISENEIILDEKGKKSAIPNDYVIVCAGGILPTEFLKDIGIAIETMYGKAIRREAGCG